MAVDAPDEVWEESWTLNFTAVRRLTQACLPAMRFCCKNQKVRFLTAVTL
jgi:NAD(P)-dependent dehydrogenase (short-subunit alcohol dehydrogenase family)